LINQESNQGQPKPIQESSSRPTPITNKKNSFPPHKPKKNTKIKKNLIKK